MNEELKLKAIDNLKVMCMLLVILGHACAIYTNSCWGGMLPAKQFKLASFINSFVATFHTQAFVTASGALFYYGYINNKYVDVIKDVKKRAKRLIVPYCIVSIFWAIPFAYFIEKCSPNDIIRGYLFVISPAQLWFLPMLFGVWTIYRITYKYIERTPLTIVFSICILLYWVTDAVSGVLPLAVFQIKGIAKNLVYFFLGIWLFHADETITPKGRNGFYRCVIACSVEVLLFVLVNQINTVSAIKKIMEPFLGSIGVYALYCTALFLTSRFRIENKVFFLLKRNSMGIFLLHQQIMYLLLLFLNSPDIPAWLTVLATLFGTILISLVFSIMLRRYKVGRIVLG